MKFAIGDATNGRSMGAQRCHLAGLEVDSVDNRVHASSEGLIVIVTKAHIENGSSVLILLGQVSGTGTGRNIVAVQVLVP